LAGDRSKPDDLSRRQIEPPVVDPAGPFRPEFFVDRDGELAVELPEFLAVAELDAIRAFAAENEQRFVQSVVVCGGESAVDAECRVSTVMDAFGPVERTIRERISEALPYVLARLDLAPVHPDKIDVQLTATNHGGFFSPHADGSRGSNGSRKISFVYFFHDDPPPFRGGDPKSTRPRATTKRLEAQLGYISSRPSRTRSFSSEAACCTRYRRLSARQWNSRTAD
jgi:hypothetical protein